MRRTWQLGGMVAVTAVVAVVLVDLLMCGRSEALPAHWNPRKGTGYVGTEACQLTLLDRDGDNRVDCLVAGRTGILFSPSYAASSGPGCGWMGFRSGALPDDLRSSLSELLDLKSKMGIAAGRPLDRDGDGSVECVVSVFFEDTALARRDGARCGEKQVSPLRPVTWDAVERVHALERQLERWLASHSQ